MDPIKHVVLLMLENHSFDQMLGCFQAIRPELDGIDPKAAPRINKDAGGHDYAQLPTDARNMTLDPMHEVEHVSKQINQGRNDGFVVDFENAYKEQATPEKKKQIMGYFPLDFLPALHRLARDFAICDRWFSSLPGPTWPNRFFALSGTSSGATMMPEDAQDLDPEGVVEQTQDTIFDRLNEKNISWKIYCHDFPLSLMLRHQHGRENLSRYASIRDFRADAAGPEARFPRFSFIEPYYSAENQNDDHPPHDVMKAQQLIADVYNCLRANASLWNSTLLVITYDEHGGFYDHVVPPRAVPPDNLTKGFTFDQYGIRVPALLVSPWVEPGVVKTEFDHTSVLKYLIEKWGLNPLTARVTQANSIGSAIRTTGEPRSDTVKFIGLKAEEKRPSNVDLEQEAAYYESANHRVIKAFCHEFVTSADLDVPMWLAKSARGLEFAQYVFAKAAGWQWGQFRAYLKLHWSWVLSRVCSND